MQTGHPVLSTFHAGSIETVVKRLTTPPIDLSPTLIESLDVIAILTHAREKGKSARRMKEVTEIVSVDAKTGEVSTNVIFRWNPVTDEYEKANDSVKIEKFATARGATVEVAMKEIEQRKKLLEWMDNKGIKDYLEVSKIINRYYKEPEKLFAEVGEEFTRPEPVVTFTPRVATKIEKPESPEHLPQPVLVEAKQRPSRTSILELLGFKIIREK